MYQAVSQNDEPDRQRLGHHGTWFQWKIDDNKQVNKYIEKIISDSDMKKIKQEYKSRGKGVNQRRCL